MTEYAGSVYRSHGLVYLGRDASSIPEQSLEEHSANQKHKHAASPEKLEKWILMGMSDDEKKLFYGLIDEDPIYEFLMTPYISKFSCIVYPCILRCLFWMVQNTVHYLIRA